MAASDIKILEARLLTRDSAITGSTVTRCASRMQQLFSALRGDPTAEAGGDEATAIAAAAAQEAFARDLLLYKVEMGKFQQAFNMLDEEAVEYENLEREIEAKIEETSESIVTLTQELGQQKKIKKHRDECEALSRLVNLVPSTRTIMASSNLVSSEISRLEEQLASTEAIESQRHRQVNLLLQSIADLSKSLEEEDDLQKQLLALQQSVDNQTQEDDDAVDDNDDDVDGDDESRDKRSERSTAKRKKPSGDDSDDLEIETTTDEKVSIDEEVDNNGGGDGTQQKKQKVSVAGEVIGEQSIKRSTSGGSIVSSSGSSDGKLNSPTASTIKEKLQQQQAIRAQKKLEKELREKELQHAKTQGVVAEPEEGEEEEDGVMDTSA